MNAHCSFVTAAVLVTAAAALAAQAPPTPAPTEYGRAAKLDVQAFDGPDKRIHLEYPKKDWELVPGGIATIASLVQKKGEAAVVIEASRLNQPLSPDDITDLFGQLEGETVRDRQPSAVNIQPRVYGAGGRRFVLLTYERNGVAGPERVRQYSIPVGSELYRLICSAAPPQFARYETVFAHIAASFTSSGATH